jgi:hypothetical protein
MLRLVYAKVCPYLLKAIHLLLEWTEASVRWCLKVKWEKSE